MRWLQNLRLSSKFILIALLFMAPVLLLGYLFVAQSLKDVDFARRERAGTIYLGEMWPGFQAAIAGREPAAPDLARIASAGERYDALMDTAAARRAFVEAPAGAARIAAGQDFIQKIADGSWLTLDPDLDSYYVMDASTTKIPEVAAAGAAARRAADFFGRGGRAGVADEAGSAFAVGRLLRGARALGGSYESAANGNPDGTVRGILDGTMRAALSDADRLGRSVEASTRMELQASGAAPVPAASLDGDHAALQADVDALWRQSVRELDQLLARRVEGLWSKLATSLALASALLVAVILLMTAVSRSITQRLADVASRVNAMRGGDLEHVVPHRGGRDEIGVIAGALEVFRERLISLRAFEGDLIAQETNRAAESRFRDILDVSPIGVLILTKAAKPLYCNAGFAEMLGCDRATIMSRDLTATWSDGSGLLGRLRSGETIRDHEMRLRREDGGEVTCLLSGEPIEYEGEDVALRWVYDISERKKAEAQVRAAQQRLVQSEKLASLGQLTAGIAHEIKNPLNFVNNFSDLSRDLLGELEEVLASAGMDGSARDEVAELSAMIRDNLEKVAQHGRRADSIVKNMLLHSRSGGGERRAVDVNATLKEALNLAYHGARAGKSGFNATLVTDFDAAAGELEVFPQELTRVVVNLVTNGFYALTKKKATMEAATAGAAGGVAYEPTLTLSTRGMENGLEIRIRDNGTGIPDEVKAKMFTPFFTTKPAGEGTGLGLSLSHDIIVKQHNGTIDLHSRQGEYTEFVIALPRSIEKGLGERGHVERSLAERNVVERGLGERGSSGPGVSGQGLQVAS